MNSIWLALYLYLKDEDSDEDNYFFDCTYMTNKEIVKFLAEIIFVFIIPIFGMFLTIPYTGGYFIILMIVYFLLLLYYIYKKYD